MTTAVMEKLIGFETIPEAEMTARAEAFHHRMKRRRTVRDFDPRPVPRAAIEHALRTAGTAPSGANLQPWHFAVIADPAIKREIRLAAEAEERAFYADRASAEWLEALAPLGTDANKPFLEAAPILIAIFAQKFSERPDGRRIKHYYVAESVGIATGFLIACLHEAGLATLTHTPSPMGFLNRICRRPAWEKPYILLVVGYPVAGACVPRHGGLKKPLAEIASWL